MFISACSSLGTNNIAPGYKAAYENIRAYLYPIENNEITPELIRNIPYSSALLKIGRGSRALIILESKTLEDLNFVSSDNVYVRLRHGKIIFSSGLHNNLIDYMEPKISKRNNLNQINKTEEFYAYYSYDKPELNHLKLEVKITKREKQTIDLFTNRLELTLFEEEISNSYIGWKVKNSYWVDEKGFVWKSIQYISPKLPKFEIIITKKPA